MTVATPPKSRAPASATTQRLAALFQLQCDHKVIGLQYLVCGFVFYLVGGALAGAIRTELASPVRTSWLAMSTTKCSPCTAR